MKQVATNYPRLAEFASQVPLDTVVCLKSAGMERRGQASLDLEHFKLEKLKSHPVFAPG